MNVSSTIRFAAIAVLLALFALVLPVLLAPAASAASSGTLQFSAANYVTSEAAGTVTLEIERVGGSDGEISATIQTFDGSATIVDDYAGIPTPLTLTWSDGNMSSKTVTLPIKPDVIVEGDETFTMQIVSAHAGTPSTATVTIGNTPNGTLQFSAANYVTSEAAGTVTLEIERVGGSDGEISATIQTFDGSATIVDDYAGIPTPLTLTWSDGNMSSKTVTLPIKTDAIDELDETFTMQIVSAHGGTPATATVTITGSGPAPTPTPTPTATPTPGPTPPAPTPDPSPTPAPTETPVVRPAGVVEFVAQGYTVTEAHCTVAVELQRVEGVEGEVTAVVATASGSATAGQDFVAISAVNPVVVTWADGDDSNKVVLVKLIEDGMSEADESFNVVLLETVGAGQGQDSTSIVITETAVNLPDAKAGCGGGSAAVSQDAAAAVEVSRQAKVVVGSEPGVVASSATRGASLPGVAAVIAIVALAGVAAAARVTRSTRTIQF